MIIHKNIEIIHILLKQNYKYTYNFHARVFANIKKIIF